MSANGFDEVASCVVTAYAQQKCTHKSQLLQFKRTPQALSADSGIFEIQNAPQLIVITNAIYFSKIKSNSCISRCRKLKFIFGQFFSTV